ncbi:TetR/AcrR family transcriptional regulator [Gordonia soli]|uniref:TetR/AcrR family transcriptional regulator n=1 Tax=Gordonia soli TaxID=320799 RepID=UPI000347A6EC|nr:TetR/AcrR family transcriptional regulator [Gordonia soli]
MRTHGWAGALPANDDDARRQIVETTGALLDEGADLSMIQVARAVGISRQTLYRYYPNIDSLLQDAADRASIQLLDALTTCVAGLHDPADAVVEALAFVVDQLTTRPRFTALFGHSDADVFSAITSDAANARARDVLRTFDVDWRRHGWSDDDLSALGEHVLRTLQSFVLAPGSPERTAAQLRAYLRRWVAPAVRAH